MTEPAVLNRARTAIALIAILMLAFAVTITLAVLRWAPRPDNTYLWLEMYNWGHIWLFATVTLIASWALAQIFPQLRFSLLVASATIFCITLAGGSELLQIGVSGRNADIKDFGRDVSGIAAAVAGLLLWRQLRAPTPERLKAAVVGLLISLPMLLAATWPVVNMLRAYDDRNPALPVLFSPDLGWSRSFVRNVRSKLSYDRPPEGFSDFTGQHCLHVRTSRRRYSGAEFPDLHADWSAYQTLSLEIWSGARTALPFLIRLDSARDPYLTDDWANVALLLQPGSNRININLDELVNAGSGVKFDTRSVYNIVAVTTNKSRRYNLCFGAITLGS